MTASLQTHTKTPINVRVPCEYMVSYIRECPQCNDIIKNHRKRILFWSRINA